ncbi:hypothetical protein CTI12_AA188020 [Artemisia annua]|uniref:Myb-like domain-containing protein n=1 Tax=Artemisia annua TaxID=35608 RepID=A0A2U1NX07_ARTAN|nr:hypothetical protein CTI12_AA188020 [Artemisia annua]
MHAMQAGMVFKKLITAFESSQGNKSHLLKSTYDLLIQLSSKQQFCIGTGTELNELFIKTNDDEVLFSLQDVYTFSSILFKYLQKRLTQLHCSKHGVSASQSVELKELCLLIRCCLVILTFHVPQEHLLESGRVILSLLEVAGHNNHSNQFLCCQCTYSGENPEDSFAEVASVSSFDPCIPSITTIHEVLIDELLVHGQLRRYLQISDSLSPTNERLFKHGIDGGDCGVIMEIICSHLSLSISDEGALQEFLNKITWVHFNKAKSAEISTVAARALLQNPIVLSSPKLLQAHIISLVSDVVGVGIDSETLKPDPALIDFYLSAFESSVMLYTQHMSILKTENHSTDARGLSVNIPSFESCIEPAKMQKLDEMINRLTGSWNLNLRKKLFKRKSDLLTSSILYIQQSLCVLDTACRDEILSLLRCILTTAANDVYDRELPLNGDASLQDICYLASLLMLMSNSLIRCLRFKEYGFIVGTINSFKEFSIRLPVQKFSHTIMDLNRHKESKLMLIHFLGLLSWSFDSGPEFLVNSCISVIMALTNLFVLQEGNIDALSSLADPRSLTDPDCPEAPLQQNQHGTKAHEVNGAGVNNDDETYLHINQHGTTTHEVNDATFTNEKESPGTNDNVCQDTSNEGNQRGEDGDYVEQNSESQPSNDDELYQKELNDILAKKQEFFSSICKVGEGATHSEKANRCMKCNKGGELLVCSSNNCSLVFHKSCLASKSSFDYEPTGRFYCPFCRYSQALSDCWAAEKNASLATNKLVSFNRSTLNHMPKTRFEKCVQTADEKMKSRHGAEGGGSGGLVKIIPFDYEAARKEMRFSEDGSHGPGGEDGNDNKKRKREKKKATGRNNAAAERSEDFQMGRRRHAFPASPEFTSSQRRRVGVPWTQSEEDSLKELVAKFMSDGHHLGRGFPWIKIRGLGASKFQSSRTPMDLKDKWRNMQKASKKSK